MVEHTTDTHRRADDHHVEASASLSERVLRTLKGADAFMVADAHGDLVAEAGRPDGVFFHDTRHLSTLILTLDGRRPLLLGSVLQEDNAALSVDMSNPERWTGDGVVPGDVVSLQRTVFMRGATRYDRIGVHNFDAEPRTIRIEVAYGADFKDLFEVRGAHRSQRGVVRAAVEGPAAVGFVYEGLDDLTRRTRLCFQPTPISLTAEQARFETTLAPGESTSIFLAISCGRGDDVEEPGSFFSAYRDARRTLRARARRSARIESASDLFDSICARARTDINTLLTSTETGDYPYAGIPWYATVFGRDGIITAMMMLWADPAIAAGVLRYLAQTQADSVDPAADAQPGKILHERRHGEMARLGEVPFERYYGTVDATPLFVMLAGGYVTRTGDMETLRAIWPNVRRALAWIDDYGDRDGDGFVEYFRETDKGLANQGWKDSHDSVFHADGSDALGPIALCEVQGYVYAAKVAAADMARRLGEDALATRLETEAADLRQRFDAAFWCEDIGTYALALDGEKRPCRIRTSNAGHALFSGIAPPERAPSIAACLLDQDGFSGWGIRTLARGQARYNPMSYHNGSIWPHDNAVIALGLARYGLKREAARVFEAMVDVAGHQEMHRLPELFCGFIRRRRRGPTSYPVACSPQAWAAATPFALVEAVLGLDLEHGRDVVLRDAVLPGCLSDVILRNLRHGDSTLDLRLRRHGEDLTLDVLSRTGTARVSLAR